jgi:6-phosphofructo-2-kinase / fructose-2,6-biphosphatase 2
LLAFQSIDLSRSGIREDHTASYFSHENVEATKLRDKLASDSLEMLIQWLKDGGNVGILGATPEIRGGATLTVFPDATNSTLNRRQVLSAAGALTSDG